MSFHVPAGAGESRWVVGDTYTFKATADMTAGVLSLLEASIPPGAGPPPHVHANEDEAFYVLAGVLEFSTEEQTYVAHAGDLVFLPRGVPHSFTNPGVGAARALMLLTPGGFERYFQKIGVPARPGQQAPRMSGEDLQRAIEAARQYGMRILLPVGVPPTPDPHDRPAERLFRLIDSMDLDKIVACLAEDARLALGNGEPLVGRAAITAGLQGFLSTIDGLQHKITREWSIGSHTVAETEVTYRRLDGRSVCVPAASIWHTREDGLIDDYRIFVDLTPVYAP